MPEDWDGKVDGVGTIYNSELLSIRASGSHTGEQPDYKDMVDIPRNIHPKYCLSANIQKRGMAPSLTALSPKVTKEFDKMTQDITKATDKISEEKETEDIEDEEDEDEEEDKGRKYH